MFIKISPNISDFENRFVADESLDGGLKAKAIGYSIYTQAATIDEVKFVRKDLGQYHFDGHEKQKII
ncbi:MAG: 2-oxoisovalerate dehydrogenase [Ignavibacteria bacterium]|nr:2-oxoisovalerate dehydrogenase [Ignavibacteria bacterium]